MLSFGYGLNDQFEELIFSCPGFSIWIYLEPLQARMSPMVTECAPPLCLAHRNFSRFLTIGPNSWAPTTPMQGF